MKTIECKNCGHISEKNAILDDLIGKPRVFGMRVSVQLFETEDTKIKDDSKIITHLSLPVTRGGAEMSEDEKPPTMLIATFPGRGPMLGNEIDDAVKSLIKELNHNLDTLREQFVEKVER